MLSNYEIYKQTSQEDIINRTVKEGIKSQKIQEYTKYAEEYSLKAKTNDSPIMRQAEKIFREEIEVLQKELEISKQDTARIENRDIRILNQLKPETEVKEEPLSLIFREKNNKEDKETLAKIEALKNIKKTCEDRIKSYGQKLEEYQLDQRKFETQKENCLSLKSDITNCYNNKKVLCEREIKKTEQEIKLLESKIEKEKYQPRRALWTAKEQLPELKSKQTNFQQELKNLEKKENEIKEIDGLVERLSDDNRMLSEFIEVTNKILKLEETKANAITEIIKIEIIENPLEQGNLSKEKVCSQPFEPKSQLKEISEERLRNAVEFSETIENIYKTKSEEYQKLAEKSICEEVRETYKKLAEDYAKRLEEEMHRKHKLMGVPETVNFPRHGMLINNPCSSKCSSDKKLEENIVPKENPTQVLLNENKSSPEKMHENSSVEKKEFKEKEFDWKRTGAIRKNKLAGEKKQNKLAATASKSEIPTPKQETQPSKLSADRLSFKTAFGDEVSFQSLSFFASPQRPEEKEAGKNQIQKNKPMLWK